MMKWSIYVFIVCISLPDTMSAHLSTSQIILLEPARPPLSKAPLLCYLEDKILCWEAVTLAQVSIFKHRLFDVMFLNHFYTEK